MELSASYHHSVGGRVGCATCALDSEHNMIIYIALGGRFDGLICV